jgi:hypothetical protein
VNLGKVGFDPGHHANCNAGPGTYREGNVMLTLGNALKETYSVFTTRIDGNPVDYYERAKKVKDAGCDTFLSLHTNAPIEANGVIVIYSLQRPNDKEIAECIGKEISKALGLEFRGAKTRQYPNKPGVDYYAVIRHSVALGIEHVFIVEHGSHWEFAVDTEKKIQACIEAYGRLFNLNKARYYIHNNTLQPTIKKGSTGSAVKLLQSNLNAAGFNCGAVDGIFGSKTDKAVRNYQKACELVVDGIAGPKTWAALLNVHVVELEPKMLKASLVNGIGSNLAKLFPNFINANFFSGAKTIGWLASEGKILSERDNHKKWLGLYDKPKGTVIVYKDGSVDIGWKTDKDMDTVRDKIYFCCQGFNLVPLDLGKEGFSLSAEGRTCNSVMMGYNEKTGKIIIAVRQGTDAYRAVDTMRELGCSKAIRLDSGGSANMFVNGKAIFKTSRTLTNIVCW